MIHVPIEILHPTEPDEDKRNMPASRAKHYNNLRQLIHAKLKKMRDSGHSIEAFSREANVHRDVPCKLLRAFENGRRIYNGRGGWSKWAENLERMAVALGINPITLQQEDFMTEKQDLITCPRCGSLSVTIVHGTNMMCANDLCGYRWDEDTRGQPCGGVQPEDPVIKGIMEKPTPAPTARPTFESIFAELNEMQIRKGKDYGTGEDPLANLRASERFGIPAWAGTAIRMQDKMNRIASFIKKGRLENESLEDSLIDIAVYAIHAIRLYREEKVN